jgi:mono/diheme cytochrome c family protein
MVPVGTRLWKEFAAGGQVVETRLIARTGATSGDDWLFATYQWSAVGAADAQQVIGGVTNANGTEHDIPSLSQCGLCHGTLPERVLGFSAIQLTHPPSSMNAGDVTLESLAAEGKLSAAPADGGFPVPGDAVAARALGYLHANCGNCHHPAGIAFDANPFSLRLEVGQRTPQETSTWLTAVGVPVETYFRPGVTHRVAPGNPDASCISARISRRGPGEQMPPLATEHVDDAGVAAVNAWIRSLP